MSDDLRCIISPSSDMTHALDPKRPGHTLCGRSPAIGFLGWEETDLGLWETDCRVCVKMARRRGLPVKVVT